MKINYTGTNGKRSTITLSDALIDTWLMTRPELREGSLAQATAALRDFVEETPTKKGETFVQSVEYFLLAEIRDHIAGLNAQGFQLERERDGV